MWDAGSGWTTANLKKNAGMLHKEHPARPWAGSWLDTVSFGLLLIFPWLTLPQLSASAGSSLSAGSPLLALPLALLLCSCLPLQLASWEIEMKPKKLLA